ncbi:MAG TPA: hypothetical protein GX532_03245, partial [Clostridia bacterium]|nr:hypothetical protein [Clostridia bacterium]
MGEISLNFFKKHYYIGIVLEVSPNMIKMHMPSSLGGARVGELIFIECDNMAILGKIIFVKLHEKGQLIMQQELGEENNYSTIAEVQLLATVNVKTKKVERGIKYYPRVGSKAYLAEPQLITWVVETSLRLLRLQNH